MLCWNRESNIETKSSISEKPARIIYVHNWDMNKTISIANFWVIQNTCCYGEIELKKKVIWTLIFNDIFGRYHNERMTNVQILRLLCHHINSIQIRNLFILGLNTKYTFGYCSLPVNDIKVRNMDCHTCYLWGDWKEL